MNDDLMRQSTEQQPAEVKQEYVCGFMFNDDLSQVVLIRKNKPEWQLGKLNGVGGKVEHVRHHPDDQRRESPHEAMAREFHEECGVVTMSHQWELMRTERFPGAVVHFLFAVSESALRTADTKTDEQVVKLWVSVALKQWRDTLMYNLPYLLEMALALDKTKREFWPQP